MKKLLLLISLLLMMCQPMLAQSSMSDAQIIEFVQKEQNAGTPQKQIAAKLVQKGVSVQRLQELYKKYQDYQEGDRSVFKADEEENRMRKANANSFGKRPEEKKNSKGKTVVVQKEGFGQLSSTRKERTSDLTLDEEFDWEKLAYDMEAAEEENRMKVFGRDIFQNEQLSFEPNMNIATPQNYVLGPGDAVNVDIYGASQKSFTKTISPDGTIVVEGYGPVALSGLTIGQAEKRIRSTVGSQYSSSDISLTLGQTRTISVNIMGEVKIPGTYTLSAFATVFHALYSAGGINDIGTLRNITVYRAGKKISEVDIYEYILNGNMKGNVTLTDGDVVMVGPYDCLVNLTGKVKRPMYYEMKKNESLASLLEYGGGFANDAYTENVRVVRKTGRLYSVHNVSDSELASFMVNDGDSIGVDSIMSRFENMVEIQGAVFRPGMYQIGGDVTTVGGLLKKCAGITEKAFTARAVMHRMQTDRTLVALPLDIKGIMNGTAADVALQNEDKIFIPSNETYLNKQIVSIYGEVEVPGDYQYAANESIEDLILRAGGLTEAASVMKIDIARRIVNPSSMSTDSVVAKHFSVSLKDGLAVDGDPVLVLEPFDEVFIRRSPSYATQRHVKVDGQVNFEGTYTLTKHDVRLSDIIRMCGGLTAEANPAGASLTRRISEDEIQRKEALQKLTQKSGSKDSINLKSLDIADTYTVGIDLAKALDAPGSTYDILLREGDALSIPEFLGTVKINGEVTHPNTTSYIEGKSVRWYVKHAGGYSSMAKKRNTYIIHQNGMVEKASLFTKVTPGSEIVVPEKRKREANTQNAVLVISAVSALATVGAVLVSALK